MRKVVVIFLLAGISFAFLINKFTQHDSQNSKGLKNTSIFSDMPPVHLNLHTSTMKDYHYESNAGNFTTNFKKCPGSNEAVHYSNMDASISFSTPIITNCLQDPTLEDNKITFKNKDDNIDIRYTTTTQKLLEEFIVADYQTATKYQKISQIVHLKNIDKYKFENGEINLLKKGKKIARIPIPVMYELDNTNSRSYGIEYTVKNNTKDQIIVTKNITKDGIAWLKDPKRNYPVVIDLVIDNADTASNWVSSDNSILPTTQESTIKQEGTGSVKLTTNWYDMAWSYRIKLTIDATKVDADLSDFPVYLNLNNLPAEFHSHVNQTDGRDIRVTKDDGTTELPREVVFYSAASDTGELHFKYSGTLSGTNNTDVYIYYGNAAATDYAVTDMYGRNNVWDANYVSVWHLNETAGTHYDSKGLNNSSSVTVTAQGTAVGKLGGTDQFDGENDLITITESASLRLTTQATIEMWIKPTSTTQDAYAGLFSKTNGGSQAAISYVLFWNEGSGVINGQFSNGTNANSINTSEPVNTDWRHIAFSWDTTNLHLYNNAVDTTPVAQTINAQAVSTHPVKIGGDTGGTDTGTNDFFNGLIDEVRVSNTARSSTWLSTQYNNHNIPGTFFSSFGSEQSIAGQNTTLTTAATDLSGYTTLTYWVYSNRTGQFMRFQFGESSSTEQTNNITVNAADTWEQKTWEISAIVGTSRDTVTKFAFEVTDAASDFDFYFDDIQVAGATPSPTPTPAPTAAPTASPVPTATEPPAIEIKGLNLKGVNIN